MLRFIVHSVHFLLPVLFLIAPSGAAGQVTQISPLQGTVLDETGAPIVAARVTVRLDIRGAQPTTILTDGRGTFTRPVMPGPYAVRIESDGFDALWRDVTVEAGHSSVMDVVLKVAGFSDRVDVDARVSDPATLVGSATKTPTPRRDVPQAVSVVTRELIADQRMASRADVVRFRPGVTMAQGEGNRDTPILRGNASTSDFFVDGVRDDVQYFRDVYNVERVEAPKGPNAMI